MIALPKSVIKWLPLLGFSLENRVVVRGIEENSLKKLGNLTELLRQIKPARKTDLFDIGARYGISLNTLAKKKEIFRNLIEELVERDYLTQSPLNEIPADKDEADRSRQRDGTDQIRKSRNRNVQGNRVSLTEDESSCQNRTSF